MIRKRLPNDFHATKKTNYSQNQNAHLAGVHDALRELETSVATLRYLSRKSIWHDAAHNTIANSESV
jgi:hypothetical protein